MTETIKVSESLELHAVAESHVTPLYQLICKNKTWLQQSLNWPQFVQSEEDTRKTVQGNVMLHQRGYAKMFMIFKEDELIVTNGAIVIHTQRLKSDPGGNLLS